MREFKNGATGVYDWLKKAANVIGCDNGFNPTSFYNYIFDDVPKVFATIGQDTTNTKLVCSIDCVGHTPIEEDDDNNREFLIDDVRKSDGSIFGGKSSSIAMDRFLHNDKRYFIHSFYDQRNSKIEYYIVIACNNCIAYTDVYHSTVSNISSQRIHILAPDNKTAQEASDYLINHGCNLIIPPETKKCRIGIAYKEYGDIATTNYDLIPTNAKIEANYNDDLPYDRIVDILKKDESALMLFYGTPGTGKSTLIKHLISHVDDINFVYFDSDLLFSIGNAALLNFALDNKNTVFIMEDCEKVLVDRKNDNPIMNTLLNITDGILGDCMRLKIICTFNTDLDSVDKALLRKGRLKLKYEFKPLSLEKTKALLPSATQPMSLADIYYETEENDFSKEPQRKSIGFGSSH